MTRQSTRFFIILSIGVCLLFLGVLHITVLPFVVEYMIKKSLPILNSSESATFEKWAHHPIPIITKFYFFNVTNPNQVASSGDKPLLREVGPYVFREEQQKINIQWADDDENIVAYDLIRRWFFEADLSGDNRLDDLVYHLNVPLVASADFVQSSRTDQKEKPFLYYSINQMHNLTFSFLFQSHSIRELMFEGYTDTLIQESYLLHFEGMSIPYDRFGWFYGRNDTSINGHFEIYTGKSNLNHLGQMYSWNGSTELKQYYGKCNSLTRVAAEFPPPFQDPRPDSIKIFVPDICRPLTLFFDQKVNSKGVSCNRYVADGRTFDYSIEQNRCFCRGSCPRSGVADTSKCTFDTPVAFSLPHFHFADPFYGEQVRGLNPSPGRHALYMDIHPVLGIPIRVQIAAQISILVRKDVRVDRLKNMKQSEIYFPILWFSASATASDQVIYELRILQMLPFYVTIIGVVLLLTGILIIIFIINWNWEEVSMNLINYRNKKRLQERVKRQQQTDGRSWDPAGIPLTSRLILESDR